MRYNDAVKELASMIGANEKVLWFGKPDKKCFILKNIVKVVTSFINF
ncbi:hypothetical protein IJX73_03715 [bacterium]|nr:hypothetical protein [bacterium]